METTNAAPAEPDMSAPAALMRGTARGLEWNVDGKAGADAVVSALEAKLNEAPAFFRGSDVRVVVDSGPLASSCLMQHAELATRFALRIVEVGAPKPALPPAVIVETGPVPVELAEGSAPTDLEDADQAAALEEPSRFANLTPTLAAVPKTQN